MNLTVDRFEGNFAVVELPDGKLVNFPKESLPPNAREGSILSLVVNESATEEKLSKITKRMKKLFKD